MRSLNTSLPLPLSRPRSRSRHRHANRPELIQAFKGAALAVTNLYKSAVADESRSRSLGYQSALEDLLGFLDAEGLGVQDSEGEGGVVRQWVMGRLESGESELMDSEEERERERGEAGEKSTTMKSSSPVRQQEAGGNMEPRPAAATAEAGPEVEANSSANTTKTPVFTFTANPTNGDVTMQTTESEAAATTTTTTAPTTTESPVIHQQHPPLRVEVKSKASRVHKGGRTATRLSNRDPNLVGGTKRKLNFPDFFDFTNDGTPGGERKRGRFG